MTDVLLWLSDRLELSVPLTLGVLVVAVLAAREWKRRRKPEAPNIRAGKHAQQQVVQGNHVRGDMKVKQSQS